MCNYVDISRLGDSRIDREQSSEGARARRRVSALVSICWAVPWRARGPRGRRSCTATRRRCSPSVRERVNARSICSSSLSLASPPISLFVLHRCSFDQQRPWSEYLSSAAELQPSSWSVGLRLTHRSLTRRSRSPRRCCCCHLPATLEAISPRPLRPPRAPLRLCPPPNRPALPPTLRPCQPRQCQMRLSRRRATLWKPSWAMSWPAWADSGAK